MAKTIKREEALNIAGSHAEPQTTVAETTEVETKVRKSAATSKKQADNTETRPVTCYMPKELAKQLRLASIERDCSMTNLINMAVEEYLQKDN